MQQELVHHPSDWSGGRGCRATPFVPEDFFVPLSPAHIAELRGAASHLLASVGHVRSSDDGDGGSPPSQSALASSTAANFPLRRERGGVRQLLRSARRELIDGRGLVILRHIPVGELSEAATAAVYAGIGLHLGSLVSQSDELGDVIGSVTPARGKMAVRGYRNSAEQNLHTDGTVDFVGMLCMRPADDGGGVSRLSSCTAAFNDLVQQRDPSLLGPLFRGFRYHLGENLAVVRPQGVPIVTPNRVPVLSWGPRVLGAGKSTMQEATDFAKRGLFFSEEGNAAGVDGARSTHVRNDGACVNVRYLRSYIDDAAIELRHGPGIVGVFSVFLIKTFRANLQSDAFDSCTSVGNCVCVSWQ